MRKVKNDASEHSQLCQKLRLCRGESMTVGVEACDVNGDLLCL